MIRHYPFIHALAQAATETEVAHAPQWLALSAGFHALRLFDVWADHPALVCADARWTTTIQMFTEKAPAPVRLLLQNAIRTVARTNIKDFDLVAGPFIAYAWHLRHNGQHALAADVYETLARAIDPPTGPLDSSLATTIYLQWGVSLMYNGQWNDAEARYNRALELLHGPKQDLAVTLTTRTWLANLWMQRGNLGDAETTLQDVITQAEDMHQSRVSEFARRVQGSVMQRRGRYAEALREFYTAHTHVTDDIESDLLMSDMAACLAELGRYQVARQVHTVLATVGRTPLTRILALTNLLEITVWEQDRAAFDTTLEQLRAYNPPNEIKLSILFYEAQGVELWQSRDAAIAAYQAVAETAKKTKVHHIEFRALEAIERLQNTETTTTSTVPTSVPTSGPTSDHSRGPGDLPPHIPQTHDTHNVDDVASAISALCDLKLAAAMTSE